MYRFLLILLVSIASTAQAEPWTWTPSGPHHKAVVYVEDANNFAGTGTLVFANADYTEGLILTAAHVIGSSKIVTAKWREEFAPYSSSGLVIYNDKESDVALFRVDPPDNAVVIPISPRKTAGPAGAQVECIGLGSPRASIRPYVGTISQDDGSELIIDTHVTSGDSGGPILLDGMIVGTITGGINTTHTTPDGWRVFKPLVASTPASLHRAIQCIPAPT